MEGNSLAQAVREIAHPLSGTARDYDPLISLVSGARFVLLGEASHGTHDFYRERAEITKRLITEKGFTAVAIEGGLARRLPRQPIRARREQRHLLGRCARRFPAVPYVDVAQYRRR